MDILVSSNLERLLFLLSRDSAYVAGLMRQLSEDGSYQLSGALLEKLYTEKISSRLAAFVQIKFLGSDIRVQKAAE